MTGRESEIARLKSDFVANVSHDLKTPLALIRMFAETLEMDRVPDEHRRREYYGVLTRESERLSRLIDNVLDFSRIESGRQRYEIAPGPVEPIVHEVMESFRHPLHQQGFTVDVSVEPDLPDVPLDPDAVKQALANLVDNAMKYSADRRHIRVAVRRDGAGVSVEVADEGIGIPVVERERIFEKFYRVGQSETQGRVPLDALEECIPGRLWKRPRRSEGFLSLKTKISRAPLDDFADVPQARPLVSFLSALGLSCDQRGQPLLLLFDKADLVIPAALVPVLETLDQPSGFVSVVATRPGHGGVSLAHLSASASPGDHYDLVHLGLHPRSPEWRAFVRAAIEAQPSLGSLAGLPGEVTSAVIALSRDSVRVGLEAFSRIQAHPAKARQQLEVALREIRARQLTAAQAVLRENHPDYLRLIHRIRTLVAGESRQIKGPVTLSIQPRDAGVMFDSPSELNTFVDAALRSGALCLADGEMWAPGTSPRRVEIPPHLLWEPSDPLWSAEGCETMELALKEAEIFKTRGGPTSIPSIFVAYRMNSGESAQFRSTLKRTVETHPTIKCRVEDGKVQVGDKWAPEIRKRIKRARLVVGDVQGMRPEVLFELGFANGLRTPILPVVSDPSISSIPSWLRATQLGCYSDGRGMAEIVSSIETHLAQSPRLQAVRSPTTSLVLWLRTLSWNATALEQIRTAAHRDGLSVETLNEADSEDDIIERARLATFVVLSFDGTEWDGFGHFLCGTALAKPYAGYSAKRLPRRIVVLEPDGVVSRRFTAEGLWRCSENVVVTKTHGALDVLEGFLRRRRLWEGGS